MKDFTTTDFGTVELNVLCFPLYTRAGLHKDAGVNRVCGDEVCMLNTRYKYKLLYIRQHKFVF